MKYAPLAFRPPQQGGGGRTVLNQLFEGAYRTELQYGTPRRIAHNPAAQQGGGAYRTELQLDEGAYRIEIQYGTLNDAHNVGAYLTARFLKDSLKESFG